MATKWKKFSRSGFTKAAAFVLAVACGMAALCGLVGMANHTFSQKELESDVSFQSSDTYRQLVLNAFGSAYGAWSLNQPFNTIDEEADVLFFAQGGGRTATNTEQPLAADMPVKLADYAPYAYLWDGETIAAAGSDSAGLLNGLQGCLYSWYGAPAAPAEEAADTNSTAAAREPALQAMGVWLKESYVNALASSWALQRVLWRGLPGFLGGMLFFAGFLLCVTGRRPEDDSVHLLTPDGWYTEVHLAATAGTCLAALWLIDLGLSRSDSRWQPTALVLCLALGALGLLVLLSLARKAKAGMLWRGSLLHVLLHPVGSLLKADFWLLRLPLGRAAVARVGWTFLLAAGGTLLGWLLSNLLFSTWSSLVFAVLAGFACTCIGALYLALSARRDALQWEALLAQIDTAAAGRSAPVPACIAPGSPLHRASGTVAELGQHLEESVAAMMKNERMKLDLITNVSHDLKTPLTSIIGYIDLLQKQELPGEAADYVSILQKKSARLADTVSDLFTLAKATSGSEALVLEPLDLVMAARQTLADMADAVEKSGLVFREDLPEQAIVLAESAKLYRVLQNIFGNALRYGLAGTRAYLTVCNTPQGAVLTLTNTANYEMDFTPEEVLARFVRADKARTTEGSGLGLSIAESLMHNFGGALEISLLGDSFAVTLRFPPCEAPGRAPADGTAGAEPARPESSPGPA